jgi:acetolactate synthase-1/3 small subunit
MDPEVSRITIVSTGDEQITEQIIKQLHKLINTIKVVDLSEQEHVEREMVLVRVKAEDKSRAEVLRIADIFRCRVVDVSASTYTLEITGNHDKIRAVLDLLKNHGIQEVARTGTLAIQRSKKEYGGAVASSEQICRAPFTRHVGHQAERRSREAVSGQL